MTYQRKFLPLLAGPVLFLLFLATGFLIGPPNGETGEDSLYEKARLLQKRGHALAKAEALLQEAESYIGWESGKGAPGAHPDPRGEWADVLEPLPAGACTWREAGGEGEGILFELSVSAPFRQVHEILAAIDGRCARFTVEEMVMRADGSNTRLILLVSVRGDGGRMS